LHVRLRNQAAALPGSPFVLTVHPGAPFALSTSLPEGPIPCEVGVTATVVLGAVDRLGNYCSTGGGAVTVECDAHSVQCNVVDLNNGSYELQWMCKLVGNFPTTVMIDGKHVVNSPATLRVKSLTPFIGHSEVFPGQPGLRTAIIGLPSVIRLRFRDNHENVVTPTAEFCSTFKMGAMLLKEGTKFPADASPQEHEFCEGRFVSENEYEMQYTPAYDMKSGRTDMYIYAFVNGNFQERVFVSHTPWRVNVGKNLDSENKLGGGADSTGTAPGDYKVDASVFEAAQRKWGDCTVDAFASPATRLVRRFWSARNDSGAEHLDALSDASWWARGECIWAHPPPELLPALCDLLKNPERVCEVIVCAPFWPRNGVDWFSRLMTMADGTQKFGAGRLHKVADDAPPRCFEWPLQLFHIPARKEPVVCSSYQAQSAGSAAAGTAKVSHYESASPSGDSVELETVTKAADGTEMVSIRIT
jgi:hypothetical protein